MPRSGLMTYLSPLAALALLAGLHAQILAQPSPQDSEPYHARLRQLIADIPLRIGPWEGVDAAVPPAARALLRPNALLSRRYRHDQAPLSANLILVQCRDTRDMSGHYPPNCYPAHGWESQGEPRPRTIAVGGHEFPVTEYRFARHEFGASTHIAIYNFFVLPAVGAVPDMAGVRRAAGDYRARSYGAAQVQIVMDASVPAADREAVARSLLEPLLPVLASVRLQSQEDPR